MLHNQLTNQVKWRIFKLFKEEILKKGTLKLYLLDFTTTK